MPRANATETPAVHAVNLRVRTETRALIDRAAKALGRTRSDFMIEAARRAAEEAILDQAVITVSREKYDAFLAILDRPAQPNEKLIKSMRTPAPWE